MCVTQEDSPHTKLEIIDDVIHQHLVYGEKEDLEYGPDDCIVFSYGERTPGCAHEKYRPFVSAPRDRWPLPGTHIFAELCRNFALCFILKVTNFHPYLSQT